MSNPDEGTWQARRSALDTHMRRMAVMWIGFIFVVLGMIAFSVEGALAVTISVVLFVAASAINWLALRSIHRRF